MVKCMEREKRTAAVLGWGRGRWSWFKVDRALVQVMKKFSGRMRVMGAQHGVAGCAYCHRTGHLKMARMVDLMFLGVCVFYHNWGGGEAHEGKSTLH